MRRGGQLKKIFFLHFEWFVLAAGLFAMALLNPVSDSASLCVFRAFGFEFCPGCGLGRSVAYVFRGDIIASLQMHPAGIPAVFVIAGRIGSIFKRNRNIHNEKHHEKNI
jgi:hypothetical protein